MRTRSYLQTEEASSTLESFAKLVDRVRPNDVLFCFAYSTMSGYAEFHRRFGRHFWCNVPTRWLVGIDYGRSHPAALEALAESPNATVRVFDGEAVVQRSGFAPTFDFHMKAGFLTNSVSGISGMLAGSGNFSRGGLTSNFECGVALVAENAAEDARVIRASRRKAEALWDDATPLSDIFDQYDELWLPTRKLALPGDQVGDETPDGSGFRSFWIQAGYVTLNRGPDRPGNQIDLPRGVHRFFRFKASSKQPKNTVIGEITFLCEPEPVTRALRLGNNLMEKITLPIPEEHGYGAYDGKVLEFTREREGYLLRTYEFEEFMDLSGRQVGGVTAQMGSGRLYGFR